MAWDGDRFYVTTIQGQDITIIDGDWIVLENPDDPSDDRAYPVAPEVFVKRYAPALEPEELGAESPDPMAVRLMQDAWQRATQKRREFGPHPSADFAACRVAEEAGELVAAATSMTRGRDGFRGERMEEEAIDLVACVLRLLIEFSNGRSEIGKVGP